ncbi:hypothetical protein [Streptomyces fildesensis]|uniref:hypothetical protein n=1 Tax=Streptomyces fildesensis TaxID=375757 RepID=UPI0018E03A25|nr:hypothetical protein [Streptomyces fildesensis]
MSAAARSEPDRPRHRRPRLPSGDGRTAGALLLLINALGAPAVAALLVYGQPPAPPAPNLAASVPDIPLPGL